MQNKHLEQELITRIMISKSNDPQKIKYNLESSYHQHYFSKKSKDENFELQLTSQERYHFWKQRTIKLENQSHQNTNLINLIIQEIKNK